MNTEIVTGRQFKVACGVVADTQANGVSLMKSLFDCNPVLAEESKCVRQTLRTHIDANATAANPTPFWWRPDDAILAVLRDKRPVTDPTMRPAAHPYNGGITPGYRGTDANHEHQQRLERENADLRERVGAVEDMLAKLVAGVPVGVAA